MKSLVTMNDSQENYKTNETMKFFDKINTILYLCGLKDFWIEKVKLPERFVKIYDVFSNVIHVLMWAFSFLQLLGFITQKDLTPKQNSDRLVLGLAKPCTHVYCFILIYHRVEVRSILCNLAVSLKQLYNDKEIERQMIKNLLIYALVYFWTGIAVLTLFGVNGMIQKILYGGPFVTLITGWPDLNDSSQTAEVARILIYLFWWVSYFRAPVSFLLLLIIFVGLIHQYKNLQSYFYSLEKIFQDNSSHLDHVNRYEEALKLGIKMHCNTLRCIDRCQRVCRVIFSAQVVLTFTLLISLMSELMKPERNAAALSSQLPMALAGMLITGYFMWNAGDITVEASKLPEAIYGSGWHNCDRHSVRIRKLVVFAMAQAQQPVVLKAFGFIELSYNSFFTIIKTAYSVFSVFY